MNIFKSIFTNLAFTLILVPGQVFGLEFTIIKTATAETLEASIMEGGSLTKKVQMNHSAVLVRHPKASFLFDTGLGTDIEKQFKKDMPIWMQPFFGYQNLTPAIRQLSQHTINSIEKIFLSHVHWDHASALKDFDQACIAISEKEHEELNNIKKTATFPSQFSNIKNDRWCSYQWSQKSYNGFSKSYDIFSDGSAVLVPLPGHTTGSVGLFLNTKTKAYFFVGDLTWSLKALEEDRLKFWLSSKLVDRDILELKQNLRKVKELAKNQRNLIIVPAHDSGVQDKIGYFPHWVKD